MLATTRAVIAVLVLVGCAREQPWVFRNGVGLDDTPPARILTEVFAGAECGIPCRPPGERVYCAEVVGTAQGPSPQGLEGGERYCFMGTAFDAAGGLVSVGCAVAAVGGSPITVTLSPSDETSREQRCTMGDGGVASPASLSVYSEQGGTFFVQNQASGEGWTVGSGEVFGLGSEVGETYEITPVADPGWRFDIFTGGGCDVFIPCRTTLAGDTRIDLVFLPI